MGAVGCGGGEVWVGSKELAGGRHGWGIERLGVRRNGRMDRWVDEGMGGGEGAPRAVQVDCRVGRGHSWGGGEGIKGGDERGGGVGVSVGVGRG